MNVQTVIGELESNTFVVETDGAVVIIDAGAPVKSVLKTLAGRTPDAILITHFHFDHVFCLENYKKAFNCPVYAPRTEDEIRVGGLIIRPILCPGHAPDCVVYKIGDALFTGDVLFARGIGRMDLPGGSQVEMKATLRRLLGVDFKTAYHGHYGPSSYAEQQVNIGRYI